LQPPEGGDDVIHGTGAHLWALGEDGETFDEDVSRLTLGDGVLTYRDESGAWTSLPLGRVLMVDWVSKPKTVLSL
jgi:hypothetical protein